MVVTLCCRHEALALDPLPSLALPSMARARQRKVVKLSVYIYILALRTYHKIYTYFFEGSILLAQMEYIVLYKALLLNNFADSGTSLLPGQAKSDTK